MRGDVVGTVAVAQGQRVGQGVAEVRRRRTDRLGQPQVGLHDGHAMRSGRGDVNRGGDVGIGELGAVPPDRAGLVAGHIGHTDRDLDLELVVGGILVHGHNRVAEVEGIGVVRAVRRRDGRDRSRSGERAGER